MLAGSCGDKSMWWAVLLRRAVSLAAVWEIWTHPSPQLSLVGGGQSQWKEILMFLLFLRFLLLSTVCLYIEANQQILNVYGEFFFFFHFIYLFIWRLSTLQYCIGFVLKENNQAKRKSLPSINVWPNWRWKDERVMCEKLFRLNTFLWNTKRRAGVYSKESSMHVAAIYFE